MTLPKISIVTPNYNGSRFLEDTIRSVIDQNYPNLEYLVIDAGSKDGSLDIIKKYSKRLTYWISEPDTGMYDGIQKGFDCSTGEIMAWINSDDMYHKNALFNVAEIFTSFPQVEWLMGASTNYDENGRTINVNQSRLFSKFDFYNRDFRWIQQESVFWRRSLWKKAGSKMKTELQYAGDFALWLKFFSLTKLYVTHALIGGFRQRQHHQITIDHFEEYLKEIESELYSLQLNAEELRVKRRYEMIICAENILKRLKIFRQGYLELKYREKFFEKGRYIVFNQASGKFILK